MQVPGGQINPGLSFFRAIQGLVQRPNQAGENAQAKSVSQPTDPVSPQQRFSTEAAQASRPADPGMAAGRAGEMPAQGIEGLNDVSLRETVGGGRMVPRGTLLDLTV